MGEQLGLNGSGRQFGILEPSDMQYVRARHCKSTSKILIDASTAYAIQACVSTATDSIFSCASSIFSCVSTAYAIQLFRPVNGGQMTVLYWKLLTYSSNVAMRSPRCSSGFV